MIVAEAFHAGELAEVRTRMMGTPSNENPAEIVHKIRANEREYRLILAREAVGYHTPTKDGLHALRLAIKYGVY